MDLKTTLSLDTGSFDSGISSAISSVNKLDKQARLTSKNMTNFFDSSSTDGMRQAFSGVDSILKKLETSIGSAGSSMKKDLRSMTAAATELENVWRNLSKAEQETAAGQELRSHIDELISQAGNLKDTMTDVQGAIKFESSDTATLDAIAGAVKGLSAGFQVAAGAASLFGVSEDKIAKVQKTLIAVMAITNGLQLIQNTLQKESAVMIFLRTAREKGLAVALGIRSAATAAATTAEEAETAAVIANTAAWMTNPIGWILLAIVGVVAGVAALTGALSDNNDELSDSAKAAAAVEEQFAQNTDTLAKQVNTVYDAKAAFEKAGDSVQEKQKVYDEYKTKLEKCGLSCKNWQAMEAAVVNNTDMVVEAFYHRAMAAAGEQAAIAELANMYKVLAEIQKKALNGEEIETDDLEAIGVSKEFFIKLNGVYDDAVLGQDWKIKSDAVDEVMKAVSQRAMEHAKKNVENIRKLTESELSKTKIDIPDVEIVDPDSVEKGGKSVSKSAGEAKSSVEKLNEEISKVEKQINELGPITDKNREKFNQLKDSFISLQKQKISLLPKNTVSDLENLKKEAQKLLPFLEKGTEEFKNWQTVIQEASIAIVENKLELVDKSTTEGLEETKKLCQDIIKILPMGHPDIKKYAEEWRLANNQLTEYNRNVDNLMKGIQIGSVTEIKQQIAAIQKRLDNENLDISTRAELEIQKDDLQQQLNNILQTVDIGKKVKLDLTFDYKLTELEKLERRLDDLKERRDYLQGLVKGGKLADWQLEEVNEELNETIGLINQISPTVKSMNIAKDIKEYKDQINDLRISLVETGVQGVRGLYDSFTGIGEKLENAKDGFDGLLIVIEEFISIFDSVKSVIDIINQISEATKLLTGATQASTLAKEGENTTTKTGATESLTNAAAKEIEAGASEHAAGAAGGQAAAEAMKQNSAMGPWGWIAGIAAAVAVLAMLATIMGSFADGGIIGGNSFHGDRLYARVNSGELILNTHQQANLFRLLNGEAGLRGGSGGQVEFKIKGSELHGVLKNYDSKRNRIL